MQCRQNIRPASLLAVLTLAVAALITGGVGTTRAYAATTPGNAALDWAEGHALGHPFVWGGTGSYGFDCSGLVYTAFRAEGIDLPRTTYEMMVSPHLVRTNNPQRGDLAFFGGGTHVEIVTVWPHTTFGAHDTGSFVGWAGYGGSWQPTAFYQVR